MPTQQQLQLEAQAAAHEAKQEWREAIVIYHQAITLNPKDAEVYNNLGIAYEKIDAFDHAETSYQQAIDIDPAFYPAHYNLSQLYRRNGNQEAALRAFAHTYAIAQAVEERKEVLKTVTDYLGEPVDICQQCECISSFVTAFQRQGEKILCPHCMSLGQPKRDNQNVIKLVVVAVLLAIVSVASARWGLESIARLTLYYLLYIPFAFIFVTLHELVHAVTGWLLGGKIFSLSIGQGGVIWERKIKECQVSLHKIPFSGLVRGGFPTPQALGIKTFLFLATPLLMHLAIAVVIYSIFGSQYNENPIIEAIFIVNVGFFIGNLLPFKISMGIHRMPTDGAQLLSLFTSKAFFNTYLNSYYYMEAHRTVEANQLQHARELVERGLSYSANDGALLLLGGVVALEQKQFEDAIAYFEKVLEQESTQPPLRAITWNNIAFAYVLMGDVTSAYKYAQKAYRVLPWYPFVLSTLGVVLVEMGDYSKGTELIETALSRRDEPRNIAENKAMAAVAYWRVGDTVRATSYLDQAKAEGAPDYLLRRAEQEMVNAPAIAMA